MSNGPHRVRCADDCTDRIRLTRSHATHWAEKHNDETGHTCAVSPLEGRNPIQIGDPAPTDAVDPSRRSEAFTELVENRG